jgi:hypothetical protein
MSPQQEAQKLQKKLNALNEFYQWEVAVPESSDRRFRVDVAFDFHDAHVKTCVWLKFNYTENDLDLMIARAGSNIGMILADEHHHTAQLSKKDPITYLIATDTLEIEEIDVEKAQELSSEQPVYVVCQTHDVVRANETLECPECPEEALVSRA